MNEQLKTNDQILKQITYECTQTMVEVIRAPIEHVLELQRRNHPKSALLAKSIYIATPFITMWGTHMLGLDAPWVAIAGNFALCVEGAIASDCWSDLKKQTS